MAHGEVRTRTFDFRNPGLYNSAFRPLLRNDAEFLHLWGSAGSGKSRFAAQKEIIKSFRPERSGRKTLCVRKVFNTLKDSMYSELKSVVYGWKLDDCFEFLKSPLQITNKVNSVTILFAGLDDVEKIKSISGVDRIWIEEATELTSQNELDQLGFRLRGYDKVQITLTYNPIDEHHWLKVDLHDQKPAGHEFFHSTYKDNEQLLKRDPNYALRLERTKDTNPNYYRVYALGLWGQVIEGLIYPESDTGVAFPQIETTEKDAQGNNIWVDDIHCYGLDFGFSDPMALVAQHVQDALPKKNLINKEILYESGLDGIGLVQRFDALGVRKDRKIIADSSQPGLIKTLKDAGYNVVACEKYAGSVLDGINRVRKYNLQIAAGSKNLVKEVHNYQKNQKQGIWVEDPAPNQVDHGMDAVRYGEQHTTRGGSGVMEHIDDI